MDDKSDTTEHTLDTPDSGLPQPGSEPVPVRIHSGTPEKSFESSIDTPALSRPLMSADVVAPQPGSLEQRSVNRPGDESAPSPKRHWAVARLVGLSFIAVGIILGLLLAVHGYDASKKQNLNTSITSQSSRLKPQTTSLSTIGGQLDKHTMQPSGTLTVNGQLSVDGSLVLGSTGKPDNPSSGQLYYDQSTNQLGYYNGSGFVYLQGGPTGTTNNSFNNVSNVYNVNNVSNVTNISNFTNAVTGPVGVIPMFDGTGLNDSIITESGNGVAIGSTADTSTRLSVTGSTSDSSTSALTVANYQGDTIGQFLDNGQVDLGIGPGATFGNTTIGTAQDGGIDGIMSADKFTTTNAVTVTALTEYIGSVSSYPYDQFQFAIYADNGGAPGAWIASSGVGTLTANDWNSLPITAKLAANTSYWFAYTTSSNNPGQDDPYYTLTASPTHAYANFSFGTGSESGMPATFPLPATINDYTHSVYASTMGTAPEVVVNSGGTFTDSGPAVFQGTNDSTSALQVDNATGDGVLDVDTTDNAIVLGNDGTPSAITVRGGAASGVDASGADITFDGSDGTGSANGGDIIFQTAQAALGGIQLDNDSYASELHSSPVTMSYTTGAESDRMLIAYDDNDTVSGMTYDGLPLTELGSIASGRHDGAGAFESLWYLVDPPSGTYTLSASDSAGQGGLVSAETYYDVDQSDPFGTLATNMGNSVGTQPSSLSVATTNGSQVVVDGFTTDTASNDCTTSNNNQTTVQSVNVEYVGSICNGEQVGTNGTTTMTWQTTNSDWSDIGVPLNPAVAGSTPLQALNSASSDVMSNRLDITASGNIGIDNANPQYTLDVAGDARFQNAIDTTAAFQIQNSSGTPLLTADTKDMIITIGGSLTVADNLTVQGEINANNNVRGVNVAVPASATSVAITFGTAYPDANYAVLCTPNFNSSCYVSDKTTTGFTLNFGTAAPGGGTGTVDWLVVH